MYEHLIVEKHGAVRVITLNRPHVLNALNREMRRELTEAFVKANHDDEVGSIVLTGSGERAFAAGQDLNEAKEFTPERAHTWIDEFFALYSALRNLDKSVVAAVNGYAVGAGLQIALLTDLRIASERAQLGMPEIHDGIPCITGTWTLWDIIGRSRTEDLVLTGRLLGAQEALQWGLVNRVVPSADVVPVALRL
ncbi:MAG: enoyl-CoA hydratase, partial [Acidobacteria bacterium RBG_16_64_8]